MKGLLATFLDKASRPVLALSAAAAAMIVLVAVLLVQSETVRRMEARAEATELATQNIMLNGLTVLHAMTHAETAQRGFLLTGDEAQLDIYPAAKVRIAGALTALDRLAGSDPQFAPEVSRARDLIGRRFEIMDETLVLTRSGRRAEALALLPRGRQVQGQLRDNIGRLVEAARLKSAENRAGRRAFQSRSVVLQAALAALTAVALGTAMAAIMFERANARRANAARAAMTAALEAERERAQEADRAKSRFLAAASHDMRQPLHALALYISALERRIESDQGREILGNMDGAVRSMSRMFTALLDLARLEAGILKPEPLPFAVHDLLEEIVEQAVDPRGGRAKVRVSPTRLWVHSDPDLLEIAVRNLVSNAVKHSSGGRVLVGCRRVGADVRIEVHDDGRGIPPEMLEKIFAEFVRGEAAKSTEGVGLGLAIVERMAKLLGHGLSVRSGVGRGTIFCITVPGASPAALAGGGAEPTAAGLANRRVLLADDEPLSLDAMRRVFEDAGAEVEAVMSAAAVRSRAHEPFDLYVFDLNLGRENGLRLLEELERSRGPIRALIVTGATTLELLAELRAAGRQWLTKPIAADALAAAAGRLLQGEPVP